MNACALLCFRPFLRLAGAAGSFYLLAFVARADPGFVADGAVTVTYTGQLGYTSPPPVTATVTGGSFWNVGGDAGDITVGDVQPNTSLTISLAGFVSSANTTIGLFSDSSNNTARVTDADSFWLNGGSFFIGYGGASNTLTVSDGGSVFIGGALSFGFEATSVGNRLVITNGGVVGDSGANIGSSNSVSIVGSNSVWSTSGTLEVGGNDSRLFMDKGGRLYDINGVFAGGSVAEVYGSNTVWTSFNNFTLDGGSNEVFIAEGGVITNNDGFISLVSGNGNLVWVGNELLGPATSRWINGGNLFLGQGGAYNELVISYGGQVLDQNGYLDRLSLVQVGGSGSLWTNAQNLYVGSGVSNTSSSSFLDIYDSGKVVDNSGYIGYLNAGFDSVSVSDTNSMWQNSGDLFIGYKAHNNRLLVTSGATLLSSNGYLGYFSSPTNIFGPSKNNFVTIRGPGSAWTNYASLFIGYNGFDNQLLVTNGGTVVDQVGLLGFTPFSTFDFGNKAIVTGTNSLWVNSGSLIVGGGGAISQLTISNGGTVLSLKGILGLGPSSSNNQAVITGTGSLWTNSGDVVIGELGFKNELTVSNGARLVNFNGYLGHSPGSISNAVLVTGTNSLWTNSADLFVGSAGPKNQLVISNAATVINGDGNVGFELSSSNNTVLVTGSNSLWSSRGHLWLGVSGAGNQLAISNGAILMSGEAEMGGDQFSSNNAATVTGTKSQWMADDFRVGVQGPQNRVTISNGASISSRSFSAGMRESSVQNTVLVTGSNSAWFNEKNWELGSKGGSNQLTVSAGAQVTNGATLFLGFSAPASNNAVLITGPRSLWIGNYVTVGLLAAGNEVAIRDHARMTNGGDFILGFTGTGDSNRLVVADPESVCAVGSALAIGVGGPGNSLTVSNGGTLISQTGVMCQEFTDGSNLVLVADTNSTWQMQGALTIGKKGPSNVLTIQGSGHVTNLTCSVGVEDLASGNVISVSGPGSVWNNGGDAVMSGGDLVLGIEGQSNTMNIRDGALVLDFNGTIGGGPGGRFASESSSNTVVVSGTDARWLNFGDLKIGNVGSLNRLFVSAGGLVVNTNAYLGNTLASAANSVIVDGEPATGPSTWRSARDLVVGNEGPSNTLLVTNGGLVTSAVGIIGNAESSVSNSVTVAGDGSRWENLSALYVGTDGSANGLFVTSGGTVSSPAATIGRGEVSAGNFVSVRGDSARLEVDGTLLLGALGSNNVLTVAENGTVLADKLIVGQSQGSVGNTLTVGSPLGGGNLFTTQTGSGALEVRRGTVTLLSGKIKTDRLLMDQAAGRFVFNGGNLKSSATTVANGRSFGVGDGISQAVLSLDGDDHSFADGLSISPNARLVGTATIAGTVTNAGRVAPGKSPGTLNLQGDYTQETTGVLDMEIAGRIAGDEFDQLNITGNANLGGTLNILFTNGFSPVAGDSFRFLSYGSHSNQFATVTGLRSPNGLLLTLQYHAADLTLVATNDLKLESARLDGTNFTFDVATVIGFTYVIEYTEGLNPPDWHTLQTFAGDGSLKTVTDPVTTGPRRFYRVRLDRTP